MGAPASFEPLPQIEESDCCVACLSMILGVTHSEIKKVALQFWPEVEKEGLSVKNAQRIIKKFRTAPFASVQTKDLNLETQTGILFVKIPAGYHAIILFQGVVYDPATGTVWNLHAYIATRKAKPYRLLIP